MTAKVIRELLEAKPFVSFSMRLGFEETFTINDVTHCRLDDFDQVLYVSTPEFRPPPRFERTVPIRPAGTVIIDLRLVSRVSVGPDNIAD